MSTEDSTLREVDQELAEERQMDVIRKFGPVLAVAAVVAVLGVGGLQYFKSQKESAANAGAIAFHNAKIALEDDNALGREALDTIINGEAEGASSGYAALAAFQKAAILAREGDVTQAYVHYQKIVEMEGITANMQNLARIRSAYLSLDVGGRDAVLRDLGTLPQEETPLGYYAREVVALAHLTADDYDEAIAGFENLSRSFATPAALKQRAAEFVVLARAGKSGSNLSGETRVEDLLKGFGNEGAPAAGFDDVPSFSDLADGLADSVNDAGDVNETGDKSDGTGHTDPAGPNADKSDDDGHNHKDGDHKDDDHKDDDDQDG